MIHNYLQSLSKKYTTNLLVFATLIKLISPSLVDAFPIFAQQAYESPREATGRIVCANCHLAQKPVEIEVPQGVLPDTVFGAEVTIPYDLSVKQVLGDGNRGGLNVGAVLVLPEGFTLAPKERLSETLKEETKGLTISSYSVSNPNILVIGPIPGDKNQKIVFPILSPNPAENKTVHFIKYPIYVGANRGRGQVNPNGTKTNNTLYTSAVEGQVLKIEKVAQGGYNIAIKPRTGDLITVSIPAGPEIIVKEGQSLTADQALTVDPNVGGFGQIETEIVLQSPARVKGMIAFFFTIILAQILLVLKKKQFEKVQLAEMNF
jgi:apocytochrome f|uniref:apocytochrome f n=1 Tax=Cryptomonas gyropyrenoidosa TaxID=233257 RepID=UPI0027A909A9|nr:apocytochrome f [Cryptomonas gyropyrenoidosa]WFQ82981.1 apocytochrome f [Cryptomonas gyropyrenoidosa]